MAKATNSPSMRLILRLLLPIGLYQSFLPTFCDTPSLVFSLPSGLLSGQVDGGNTNSIACFLIVKLVSTGLTKIGFAVAPR
jgi:hypothetical protein